MSVFVEVVGEIVAELLLPARNPSLPPAGGGWEIKAHESWQWDGLEDEE